ncbi:DUF916 and DUF3324 domain-containing protein [Oceanobacillus senegalensis]|uniref:DUF916 and DUF3324 domain-containing protein n=1 Tax=Oceanobacillus senegalensis TaxID=1936063 RepID=UPI001C4EA0FF|nr:DUF916 and DUF3324 domain-containing protein [Oceanobacillus senegalensis]
MIGLLFVVSEVSAASGEVGYSVRAIIPENQLDKNQTYFDLRMKPGQEQEIHVEVYNRSKEEAQFMIHITNAKTNRNGIIDYTNTTQTEWDETLIYPMTEIASIDEQRFRIPAGESNVIPITLQMPEEAFDGMILGGIYLEKVTNEETAEKQAVQIKNKYSYVIGLKLTETDVEVEPELHVKKVEPGLVNYRTAIIATIQNSKPVIVDNLMLEATVLDASGKEVNQTKVEDYRMAPNSTMDFTIDWNYQDFDPGTYTLKLHAKTGEHSWNWEEAFEIEKDEIQDINKKAIKETEIDQDDSNVTTYIIIGLIGVIFILIGVIVYLVRSRLR